MVDYNTNPREGHKYPGPSIRQSDFIGSDRKLIEVLCNMIKSDEIPIVIPGLGITSDSLVLNLIGSYNRIDSRIRQPGNIESQYYV
jgi:hypothetical protein